MIDSSARKLAKRPIMNQERDIKMHEPVFSSVEKIGDALSVFWLNTMHDDYGINRLSDYMDGPRSQEFSTKKIAPEKIIDDMVQLLFSTDQRKEWYRNAKLFVVECDL